MSYYIIWYHSILYCIMLYHSLCCRTLYYVLYYIYIILYIVLYCIVYYILYHILYCILYFILPFVLYFMLYYGNYFRLYYTKPRWLGVFALFRPGGYITSDAPLTSLPLWAWNFFRSVWGLEFRIRVSGLT